VTNPLRVMVFAMAVTLSACLIGLAVDSRLVLGQPAWLKPTAFAISMALYSGTLLWMLSFVRGRVAGVVAWVTAVSFAVEMAIIVGQAARGVSSHFNDDAPLDRLLFSIMGLFIAVVWVMNLVAGLSLLRQRIGAPAFAWGVRLGLVVPSVGMLAVVPMLVIGGHMVGAPDGGPGLPIVGWSTLGGDLRVGQGMGLHGMQLLPLLAWLLSRASLTWLRDGHRTTLVAIGGLAYTGLVGLFTWQALRGQPVLAADVLTLASLASILAATTAAIIAVLASAMRCADRAALAPTAA